MQSYHDVRDAIERLGLSARGVVRLAPAEQVGRLRDFRSLLLVGMIGARNWPTFARSPEFSDGAPHPLDRWSERVISALAQRHGAAALFPFDGPPYWPFQTWARRAEPLFASPLGLLIHPDYGLWHSFRGALAYAHDIEGPEVVGASSPCETCAEKPCLSACPVGAFTGQGYDVAACAAWLRQPGNACQEGGCLARLACPVGQADAHLPEQAAFHMRAFLAARA